MSWIISSFPYLCSNSRCFPGDQAEAAAHDGEEYEGEEYEDEDDVEGHVEDGAFCSALVCCARLLIMASRVEYL
jgi:hypothetical protein